MREAGERLADSAGLSALLQPTRHAGGRRLRAADAAVPACRRARSSTARSRPRSTRRCPGMTTCITATDTFSADGKVVLLERGTKLVGETRGQVQQGIGARLRAVDRGAHAHRASSCRLSSPGRMSSGARGLPGEVNRHFWDRFGAAILITVINGAVQGAVQSQNSGGSVIVNPSTSTDVMTEVLKEHRQHPADRDQAAGRSHPGVRRARCGLSAGL